MKQRGEKQTEKISSISKSFVSIGNVVKRRKSMSIFVILLALFLLQ